MRIIWALSKWMPLPAKRQGREGDSKDNVATAARKFIPHGHARKARKYESEKENETATKGKVKVKAGVGEKTRGKSTEKSLKEIGSGARRRKNHGASSQLENGK